jgi:hypothetical protein
MTLLLFIVGCGPAAIEFAPVKGRITMDEKPVAHAKILFIPTKQRNENRIALPYSFAITDDNGKYTLKTENQQNGAIVGSHIVIISTAHAPEAKPADDAVDGNDPVSEPNEKKEPLEKNAAGKQPPDDSNRVTGPKPELIPPQYNVRSELMFEVKRGTGNQADFRLSSKPQ